MRPITLTEERILKALFVFMLIVLALLLCSSDASAVNKFRGKQVVRQKTVVRGGAARGLSSVQQTTVIGGGAATNVVAQQSVGYGVQRSFVRQRSFASFGVMQGYAAPVVAAQAVYAAPVIQAQVLAAPVVYQAPVLQQVQVQAAPVIQQQVYAAPVLQQVQVQAAPLLLQSQVYSAPALQFDVAPVYPSCVAPAAGIIRQRTFIHNY